MEIIKLNARIIPMRLLLLIFSLFTVAPLMHAVPLPVPVKLDKLDLTPYAVFRVTSSGETDPTKIWKSPDEEWLPRSPGSIKNGDAIWARFELLNGAETERLIWIGQPLSQLELFEVWFTVPGKDHVQHLIVGQDIDRDQWPVNTRAQMLPIELPPNQSVNFLVRLAGASRTDAKLTLHEPDEWRAEEMLSVVGDAFTYGAIMVMLIYHLMLFVFVRMRGYLLYVAYSGLVMLFLARNHGDLTYYFPDYEWVFESFLFKHIVAIAAIMAAIEFGRELLGSVKHTPKLDRALRTGFWLCVALIIAGFIIPWSLRTKIFQVLLIASIATLTATAAQRWLKGFGPGIWYLLSWCCIFLSVLAMGLSTVNLLEYRWVLLSNMLAVNGEVLFLSIALASNFRDQYEKVVRLHKASHRFVPAEFLLKLERSDIAEVNVGDQIDRTMTVWFSDVRGFTSRTERLSPAQTLDLVNDYLRATEPHITNNGGFIDKYIGDAIMALFDSPQGAILAAVESAQALQSMNEAHPDRPPLSAGIGLHTGSLVLGTVGSESRLSCTVLGASVNLASRLEGMTKTFGAKLIISEATREGLDKNHNLSIRPLGMISAKGFKGGFTLYEVMDLLPRTTRDARIKNLNNFEAAIAAFQNGEFANAYSLFESCIDEDPSDAAAALYAEECKILETKARDSWQGTLRLTQK